MKKKNIYQNRSQELLHLFEEAANGTNIMCVPIDYAKKDHVAMFCNGYGDIIRKPFAVKNSPVGMTYLLEQVNRSCRHCGIKNEHVFFGGEDVNSYAENFVNSLRSKGWLVANVNAHDAKKQRENLQASTDRLDLMWIFPKKVDTVKRKVSPSVFHIQPGKDTPMLSAFSADCRTPRYIQKWNARCPDDLRSVHDIPARFS